MIAFSFANLATAATIAASTTFVDATHPAANVQLFGRPHLRAYSADTTAQRFTLDFGSTTSLDVLAFLNPNLVTVTAQGNATDAWGTPAYSSGVITMGRSGNDRYHHALRPATFGQRYLSLSIPSQTTTDGAAFFALGPIWAGLLVLPPQEIRYELDEEKPEARKDLQTADGRPGPRLVFDAPAFQFTATRRAYSEADLAAWREIDRQWSAAPGQAALVCMRASHPEEVYVMRQMMVSKWHRAGGFMESTLILREVCGG